MAASASGSAGALRGKRLLGLAALIGMPLLIQLIVLIFSKGTGSSFHVFAQVVDHAYLRVIIPLALIFLGTAALGDEWEGGTASYVVGAPIARGHIVVGRWLVSAQRALTLVLPALLLLFTMCMIPQAQTFFEHASLYLSRLAWVLVGVTLVSLGYTAVFLFLGLALKRSVMTSLVYVMVFEGLIGNLPHGFATISMSFHARNLVWRMTAYDTFQPNTFGPVEAEPTTAFHSVFTIVVFIAVFLFLSTWMLKRKEVTGSTQGESSDG
jgi:ABC-2 type transport system permease protein